MIPLYVLTAVLCFAVVFADDPVAFRDCGSKGKITGVTVNNCPSLPCKLKRGTNATITMTFAPSVDIPAATSVCYGYLGGTIKTPFPLTDNNACHDMTCPAKAGASTVYKHVLPVNPIYPKVSVIVQWEVHTASALETCFTVPVVIVD